METLGRYRYGTVGTPVQCMLKKLPADQLLPGSGPSIFSAIVRLALGLDPDYSMYILVGYVCLIYFTFSKPNYTYIGYCMHFKNVFRHLRYT